MSPIEKVEYKERTITDFKAHGMTDDEALACYVYLVNPDPFKWMLHKYQIGKGQCEKLIADGEEKYLGNGGTIEVKPLPKKDHVCKCKRPVIPQ